MKVNGKTIYSMVKVLKLGPIKANTKVSTLLEESMALEHTSGTMVVSTLAIGERTKLAESVYTRGSMDAGTRESGLKTIWKAQESTFGMMAECTRDNTRTTKSMVMESTLGQTGVAMRATGLEASSTVSEPI
jgi:hypothetical protein